VTRTVVALDPATYERHAVHRDGRIWAETNCYVDIWIELLHALGHEPEAAFPFTFAIDFEGDQWTFFKFPLPDLFALFGLDAQELVIWRPLVEHVEEQVAQGRPVLAELDSFHLPDTAGSAYQRAHVKSTVAVMEIDVPSATLGYFHGQAYHRLHGDDFFAVLRVGESDPTRLPPYVEFVKHSDTPPRSRAQTTATSIDLLRHHLSRVPTDNPFPRFRRRFAQDLDSLLTDDLERFHQYSFATLRQLGACYELSATYLHWLTDRGEPDLEEPTAAFQDLSERAKQFQFRLARTVARRAPLDLSPIDEMAETWARGTHRLRERYS
jgi:hypothetical protein